MKLKGRNGGEGLLKGVFLAYFILFLHVVLLGGLGFLVFLLSGIVNYIFWVFLGGIGLILISGYFFYRRIKTEGRSLRNMMSIPMFADRSVEVSLLGGLASFKMGNPRENDNNADIIEYQPHGVIHQLEDPAAVRLRELKELAGLLDKDLITREEYDRVKSGIMALYPLEGTAKNT